MSVLEDPGSIPGTSTTSERIAKLASKIRERGVEGWTRKRETSTTPALRWFGPFPPVLRITWSGRL